MQEERRPVASSLSSAYLSEHRRKRVSGKTRCDHVPDATNPFASRLAGTRITRIGVEWVPVVLDLVAVGIRYDS